MPTGRTILGDDEPHKGSWVRKWEARIPLVEEEACKLWEAGVRHRNSGELLTALSTAIERAEGKTLQKTALNDGLRAIYSKLSPQTQRLHMVYKMENARKIAKPPAPWRDVLPPTPPPDVQPIPSATPTAEEFVEEILYKLMRQRDRIVELEDCNKRQVGYLENSGRENKRLCDEILRLYDEVEGLRAKRDAQIQQMARLKAAVVSGD